MALLHLITFFYSDKKVVFVSVLKREGAEFDFKVGSLLENHKRKKSCFPQLILNAFPDMVCHEAKIKKF